MGETKKHLGKIQLKVLSLLTVEENLFMIEIRRIFSQVNAELMSRLWKSGMVKRALTEAHIKGSKRRMYNYRLSELGKETLIYNFRRFKRKPPLNIRKVHLPEETLKDYTIYYPNHIILEESKKRTIKVSDIIGGAPIACLDYYDDWSPKWYVDTEYKTLMDQFTEESEIIDIDSNLYEFLEGDTSRFYACPKAHKKISIIKRIGKNEIIANVQNTQKLVKLS